MNISEMWNEFVKQFITKGGYKNVINKGKELNAAGEVSPLAMETSGHGALKDNYFLDDGAFLACFATAWASFADYII